MSLAPSGAGGLPCAETGIAEAGIEGAHRRRDVCGIGTRRRRSRPGARPGARQRSSTHARSSAPAVWPSAAQATNRNVRRENVPSKQAAQQRDWDERSDPIVDDPADPIDVGGDPASVGWHRVPSVEMTEADPIVAADRGDGTYVIERGARIAVPRGSGRAARPATRLHRWARGQRRLVQFVDGGQHRVDDGAPRRPRPAQRRPGHAGRDRQPGVARRRRRRRAGPGRAGARQACR